MQSNPYPRWCKQDMERAWENCRSAIRRAVEEAEIGPKEILGIGITGHGDGIYLVDERGRPVLPDILSLDSRAHGVLERWQEGGELRLRDASITRHRAARSWEDTVANALAHPARERTATVLQPG